MGTNHTAVFYDGVQLGNAQNGQVDLGKFSLDNIAEIELYNGQKSTIFQSAKGFAAGSSLYINSTQPDFEDGRSDKWKATLKGGSFGLIDPSVLWQHKISESIYSSLSAEWKKASGRYKFRVRNYGYDTTAVREDGGIETMHYAQADINKLVLFCAVMFPTAILLFQHQFNSSVNEQAA